MKGIELVFDYAHLLYYKCHKRNLNRGRSYKDSPDWIKSKKTKINSINNKDNKYFKYAATAEINKKRNKKRPSKNNKN